MVLDPELIADTADDEIDGVLEGLGPGVEAGHGGEDDRAGFQKRDDVPRVNETPWRFPWNENELSPFLQKHIGSSQERGVAATGSDPAQRGQ